MKSFHEPLFTRYCRLGERVPVTVGAIVVPVSPSNTVIVMYFPFGVGGVGGSGPGGVGGVGGVGISPSKISSFTIQMSSINEIVKLLKTPEHKSENFSSNGVYLPVRNSKSG